MNKSIFLFKLWLVNLVLGSDQIDQKFKLEIFIYINKIFRCQLKPVRLIAAKIIDK